MIESWARGRRKNPLGLDAEDDEEVPDFATDTGWAADRDGRWCYRTKTYDNKVSMAFGYDLFAFVGIPAMGKDQPDLPRLCERLVVAPGGLDVTAPALGMIDRLAAEGRTIREVVADRAWSYKIPEDWRYQLLERDVEQVVDLHENDHGVRDHEGMRIIAGTPHCPSTPEHLIDIKRPAHLAAGPKPPPTADPDKIAKWQQRHDELEGFRARIAEREKYAFRRVVGPDAKGKERWECPAQAGKVKCDNCPLSKLYPSDRPTVEAPPELATAPQCCTQRTVTVRGDVTPKVRQRYYWGSDEWIAAFNRRNAVEALFGNLKCPKTENVRRGWTFVMGIVKTTVLLVCKVVATNLRLLRTWAERTGDAADPLTRPDPPSLGFEEIEPDEGAGGSNSPPAAA